MAKIMTSKLGKYKLSERWKNIGKPIKAHEPTAEQKKRFEEYSSNVQKMLQGGAINAELFKRHLTAFAFRIIKAETNIQRPYLSEHQTEFIENFVRWVLVSDDGKFKKCSSIYLVGPLGTGKTTIAKAIGLTYHHFNKLGFVERQGNFFSLAALHGSSKPHKLFKKFSRRRFVCLDELRAEYINKDYFGSKYVNMLLDKRYDLWCSYQKIQTLITTNMQPDELSDKLNDERLYNRIQHQYQIIYLKGKNYRI